MASYVDDLYLPPWMCIKSEYLILSLLIPGPRSPANDIDIYLQPLIDELKLLWDSGVETYDASRNETFQMRATLMWTRDALRKSLLCLHLKYTNASMCKIHMIKIDIML